MQVLVFLNKGYISSRNCRRELVAAVDANKPLILLRETDLNKGGQTFAMAEDELLFMVGTQNPSKDETAALRKLLDDVEVIEFHREKYFKYVALQRIASLILAQQLDIESNRSNRPSDLPIVRIKDQICVPKSSVAKWALYMSAHYREIPADEQGSESVFDQVARHLAPFGVRVQSQRADGIPVLVFLCPAVFARVGWVTETCSILRLAMGEGRQSAARRSQNRIARAERSGLGKPRKRSSLLQQLAGNSHGLFTGRNNKLLKAAPKVEVIRLYSTEVAFGEYISSCPQPLEDLDMLKSMFDKWPETDALQEVSAQMVVKQMPKLDQDHEQLPLLNPEDEPDIHNNEVAQVLPKPSPTTAGEQSSENKVSSAAQKLRDSRDLQAGCSSAQRRKDRKASLTRGDEHYPGAKGIKEGPGRSIRPDCCRVEACSSTISPRGSHEGDGSVGGSTQHAVVSRSNHAGEAACAASVTADLAAATSLAHSTEQLKRRLLQRKNSALFGFHEQDDYSKGCAGRMTSVRGSSDRGSGSDAPEILKAVSGDVLSVSSEMHSDLRRGFCKAAGEHDKAGGGSAAQTARHGKDAACHAPPLLPGPSAAAASQASTDADRLLHAARKQFRVHNGGKAHGEIGREGIRGMVAEMGRTLNDDELNVAMAALDKDGNDAISFGEFFDWFRVGLSIQALLEPSATRAEGADLDKGAAGPSGSQASELDAVPAEEPYPSELHV